MTNPTLAFLLNEAGEEEGLGDAGIETFRDSPYTGAAREAGQNSRDAAESLPVKLTFDVLEMENTELPSLDVYLEALAACSAKAQQDKEVEFFTNATTVATAPRISVLRIADYSTLGLRGPASEPGTPFHSLLKSSGVSTKESATSGGSFGIGKNASFAVSDLQMVMYSTLYADENGNSLFAAQGKVKLISHSDSIGVPRRATGYWGIPDGFVAVEDPSRVPEWMRRVAKGTSIFCVGFRQNPGWAEQMVGSLVTNFFCAISRGEMVFEVDSGKHTVNASTVEALLTRPDIVAAAEVTGELEQLKFAEQLFRCLVSPLAHEETLSIPKIGEFRVRILVDTNLPRRIGFIRNGMLITDSLGHFGHPLKRFPSSRDFVALVEPVGGDSEKILKRLESPKHNELSAERIADRTKREIAQSGMRGLGRQLRDLVKRTTGIDHQEQVLLEELSSFFAAHAPTSSAQDERGERDPETHLFTPAKRKQIKRIIPVPTAGEDGGSGGNGGGGGGGGGGTGPSEGGGRGGRGPRSVDEPISLRDVRNTLVVDGGVPSTRRIYFTPEESGTIALGVEATGVNDSVGLTIIDTDVGTLRSGRVLLAVEKGKRQSLTVTFGAPYDGPIELLATGADLDGAES